mmetsp:Transcript_28844/g.35449  ORF Transcript_28844/g.35449 Transcript_28844/m.35449 type:complete len:660 (+) Transcript_28844:235-2214(+)
MGKGSENDNDDDAKEDHYVPFVSAAERKRRKLERLSQSRLRKKLKGIAAEEPQVQTDDTALAATSEAKVSENQGEGKDQQEEEKDKKGKVNEDDDFSKHISYANRDIALLDYADKLKEEAKTNKEVADFHEQFEEKQVLETITAGQTNTLLSKEEAARGVKYTSSLKTGWRPSRKIELMDSEKCASLRKKWHIICEGEDLPPPVKTFRDMKLPQAILDALAAKGIKRPTPIQVQGLPVALSGRDMIGIAFTGSGKTITFTLPMIVMALGEEMKMPIVGGEGPFGLILGPSRELQRQTHQIVEHFCDYLYKAGHPKLYCSLVIGGEDKRPILNDYRHRGTHMVVATPGRLNDFLQRKNMNLDSCRYMCLDEGDRMMDMGFDEEVQHTLSFFRGQRQMLLFSATMPKKFVDFAQSSLVQPVTVNVGRAGAANLDVIQEVEYVKQEAKIVYLLQCLRKSAPPVLIFCQRKDDVDDITEYLLLKGVDAVCIHGGKDQSDRNAAIDAFKREEKDVLVATDIAAKGMDFPDIQHVINFDMPDEIENYVHRIGRTGRCGKTGIATTFINKSVEEPILLDLKHLLVEAKQRVPPVLLQIPDPKEEMGKEADESGGASNLEDSLGKGCSYCGGLGHRITTCPKLQGVVRSKKADMRDVVRSSGGGGDW